MANNTSAILKLDKLPVVVYDPATGVYSTQASSTMVIEETRTFKKIVAFHPSGSSTTVEQSSNVAKGNGTKRVMTKIKHDVAVRGANGVVRKYDFQVHTVLTVPKPTLQNVGMMNTAGNLVTSTGLIASVTDSADELVQQLCS